MDANIAEAHEAIAAAIGDRICIVHRERRLTFAEVTDRSRRFANALHARGFGRHRDRSTLAGHESGQDHVALYLLNGPEYLEGMLGSWKAAAAPFNVNYRYVAAELRALLADASARVVVVHDRFAPVLAEVLDDLPLVELVVQVADGTDAALVPGAVRYEELLASAPADRPPVEWSPDDLYIAYTGGTTGSPKGVLWRQADIFPAAMGGTNPTTGLEHASLDELVAVAAQDRVYPSLVAAPLMHVAGHWLAFMAWAGGDPVVLADVVDRFDPADVLDVVEREGVAFLTVVGNAMGRPLLDELEGRPRDLATLKVLATGGAAMTAEVKAGFLNHLPGLRIIDTVGSSESGTQGNSVATDAADATAGVFRPGPTTVLLDEERTRVLDPDRDVGVTGWLARRGRIPLGYLGHVEATEATFPTVGGVRHVVPGDRAAWNADGTIRLLGRDSVCINTGGEKVFVEEVEAVLHAHPDIGDVVVVGRPSARWGSEVVAVAAPRGAGIDVDAVLSHCAGHLARYKVPKEVVVVDRIERSPSGKADYRWAATIASAAAESP